MQTELPTKLLWMDLEFTGLDAEQRIIEVAAIITDFEMNELARYEAIIHQSDEVLDGAEEWPKQNMQSLFEEVRKSTTSEDEAVAELVKLTKEHFGDEKAVLAGNSIHNDRRFITRWWKPFDELLHYRMFDVSTFKIWLQGSRQIQFEKSETHRALSDIEESIAELQWALEQLKS